MCVCARMCIYMCVCVSSILRNSKYSFSLPATTPLLCPLYSETPWELFVLNGSSFFIQSFYAKHERKIKAEEENPPQRVPITQLQQLSLYSQIFFHVCVPLYSLKYFKANLRSIILFTNTFYASLRQKDTLKNITPVRFQISRCFISALIVCLKQDSNIFHTLHLVDVSLMSLFLFLNKSLIL